MVEAHASGVDVNLPDYVELVALYYYARAERNTCPRASSLRASVPLRHRYGSV